MAKDREGRDVFLADSNYVLQMAQMDFKNTLVPLYKRILIHFIKK